MNAFNLIHFVLDLLFFHPEDGCSRLISKVGTFIPGLKFMDPCIVI